MNSAIFQKATSIFSSLFTVKALTRFLLFNSITFIALLGSLSAASVLSSIIKNLIFSGGYFREEVSFDVMSRPFKFAVAFDPTDQGSFCKNPSNNFCEVVKNFPNALERPVSKKIYEFHLEAEVIYVAQPQNFNFLVTILDSRGKVLRKEGGAFFPNDCTFCLARIVRMWTGLRKLTSKTILLDFSHDKRPAFVVVSLVNLKQQTFLVRAVYDLLLKTNFIYRAVLVNWKTISWSIFGWVAACCMGTYFFFVFVALLIWLIIMYSDQEESEKSEPSQVEMITKPPESLANSEETPLKKIESAKDLSSEESVKKTIETTETELEDEYPRAAGTENLDKKIFE